jgi:hypothetical protein
MDLSLADLSNLWNGILGEKNLRVTESCGYAAVTKNSSRRKRLIFFDKIFTLLINPLRYKYISIATLFIEPV